MILHNFAVERQNADVAAEGKANASCDSDAASASVSTTEDGLKHYWQVRNGQSLDGLPGLQDAPVSRAAFSYIDPKSIPRSQPSRSALRWINSETVTAFTLGAVTSAALFRLLQQQRYL